MSLLVHVMAWATGISVISLPTWLLSPRCPCFLCPLSHPFNPMRPIIFQVHFHGNYYAGDHIDIHDNPYCTFYQGQPFTTNTCRSDAFVDISPIDTSFFCTHQFTSDIIEKNLRQAIDLASSKADACRRVMALEPLGYIVLSNVTDERKAELVNPFAMPKYKLTGEDFKKARNSSHSFPGK